MLLDSGKAGNDMHFWERVQQAFVNPGNELYNQLQFVDNEDLFDLMPHINPGNIVFHDWKKLRSIWKSVNAAYKGALARFTVSGTHTSDFFSFCNGNLETYYLWLHLQRRPELNGMVEADLPADCLLASEKFSYNEGTSSDTTTNRTSSTGSGGNSDECADSHCKKRVKKEYDRDDDGHSYADNQVANAIRDYADTQMRAEVAKQKLRYIEAKDSCQSEEAPTP
jgi:hypothetical protein